MTTPPTAPSLYRHQRECVEAIRHAFRRHRRVLYTQPTGTGKTRTAAEIIALYREKNAGSRVAVLAPRRELLRQAESALLARMPDARPGWEMGVMHARLAVGQHDIALCSTSTLSRSPERARGLRDAGVGLVWYDEAHHSRADGVHEALRALGVFDPTGPRLIGCTATIKRLDQRELVTDEGESVFQTHAYDYPLLEAVREKMIAPLKAWRVRSEVDLDSVAARGDDLAAGELSRAVNVAGRTRAAIQKWREVATRPDGSIRPTIVFCADVEHAIAVADAFRAEGVAAVTVDGSMNDEQRENALTLFRAGEAPVATNCMLLTEGFDHPPIECVLLLRPTTSWALFSQMVGRGTRLSPATGKTFCAIIDVVDNTTRHKLCQLPGLLDLPPGMDMDDGADLEETWEESQRIVTGKRHDAREELILPSLTLDPINIYGAAQVAPSAIEYRSRLTWLSAGSGYYVHAERDGVDLVATLIPDALGVWHLGIEEDRIELCRDLRESMLAADSLVLSRWPEWAPLLLRIATWQSQPATTNQRRCLYALGYRGPAPTTKGEATRLINIYKRASRDI